MTYNPSVIRMQNLAQTSGSYLTVLLFLVTPFSTSVTTITAILVYVMWVFSGQIRYSFTSITTHKTQLFSLLLFLYLAFAMSYTSVSLPEALNLLRKYQELLLLIALIPFLQIEKYRKWAITCFTFASIITLLISCAIYFDLMNAPESARGSASLKMRITHSLLMSFFCFFCAHQVVEKNSNKQLWISLFLLTTANIFFMVEGRTGQLMYIILIILFSIQRLAKLQAIAFITFNILFLAIFLNFSSGGNRIQQGISNSQSYLQGQTETRSSMGQRLTFWKHTITLIKANPLFGIGTGSFTPEYAKLAVDDEIKTSNPHSEFLMITVQTGIIGLLLFLAFQLCFAFETLRLQNKQRWLAQGVLLSFTANSAINSSILDHTEAHWFIGLMALSLAPVNTTQNNSYKSH